MGRRQPFGPRVSTIRASDLAQLGYCEQRLVLEKQLGERLTNEQKAGIQRGNQAHDRFLRQSFSLNPSVGTSKAKPWCFIATTVFGPDAPQTNRLREFRDEVLRPVPAGRFLIQAYYSASPLIAAMLVRRPWAASATRAFLGVFVSWLGGRRK